MIRLRSQNRFADDTFSMVKSYVIKGNLLSFQILEGLAESKNLDDLVIKLRGTNYADTVSRIQPSFTANKLENAFLGRLTDVYSKIVKVAPKTSLLDAYYLKYIGLNLKVILKGKAQQKKEDEILKHLHIFFEESVGRRDLIVRVLSAESLEQAVEALGSSEFADDVESALQIYEDTGKTQVFDTYIDKAFYKKVLNAFDSDHKRDSYIRDIVTVDIDSYNALAVLRGRLWELEPATIRGLLIEPFKLSKSSLDAMIESETLIDSLRILQTTAYRKIVPDNDIFEDAIASLEDSFRILSTKKAIVPFLWDTNRTALALGSIKLTELEIKNLSAIAFGIEQHLAQKDIMSKLIILK